MMRFMGGINSVGNIRSDINDDISSQQDADKLVYNLLHINYSFHKMPGLCVHLCIESDW